MKSNVDLTENRDFRAVRGRGINILGIEDAPNRMLNGFSDFGIGRLYGKNLEFEFNKNEVFLTGNANDREEKKFLILCEENKVCVRCGDELREGWDKVSIELCNECYEMLDVEYKNKKIIRELFFRDRDVNIELL
ncbi:TPA: hypothetical protein OLY45_003070 [Clostridioides difficile]|nr:hypothetical protein [Clostridioides difficile]HCQ5811120.1 hypothetical protein [Clostridioides difficile]